MDHFTDKQRKWVPSVRCCAWMSHYFVSMMNHSGVLTSTFPWPQSNKGELENNCRLSVSLTKQQKAQIKLASLKLKRNHHLSLFKEANWLMRSENSQDNCPIKCVAIVSADSKPWKEINTDPSWVRLSLLVSFIFLKKVKIAKAIFEKVLKRQGEKKIFRTSSEWS